MSLPALGRRSACPRQRARPTRAPKRNRAALCGALRPGEGAPRTHVRATEYELCHFRGPTQKLSALTFALQTGLAQGQGERLNPC